MNLFDYLTQHAESKRVALVEEGESTSYGQLLFMAEEVAQTLKAGGTKVQDKVGILAENSAFWVACYLGILKIGAIAAPLPSRLTLDDLTGFMRILRLESICMDDRLSSRYGSLVSNTRNVLKSDVMSLKKTEVIGNPTPDRLRTEPIDPKCDLASLMFTSGSTGTPNAVRVTHKNIMANTDSIISYIGLTRDDRMMTILPFHYCFGTSLLHTHLRTGGSLVINNYFQYVEDVLNEMDTFACTGFAGVPSTFQSLLNNRSFRERSFPALRHVQQAGGKLADRSIRELRELLPQHARLFISYGQTEATARLSYLPPEKIQEKTGSIGRGIPGVELKILDPESNPVSMGEVGEIVAKGKNVTAGYLEPDLYNNPFRNGQLYTGDLAYADQDGFIFIVGREKDFIKPNGFKVMTATIEQALLEIPEITEAAVIGIPHDKMGEAAKAFVVLKEQCDITIERIQHHCKMNLPPHALPCHIEFMPSLPRNSSGKIVKRLLNV